MTNALETTRNLESLMRTAGFGTTFGPSVRDCEDRANAAMKVRCFLTNTGYWGGPAPTVEEAREHAARAWPQGVPAEVAKALR